MKRNGTVGFVVLVMSFVPGCKDSRDDAVAASTPATQPTISVPPDVDGLRIKGPGSDEVALVKTTGTWRLTAPSAGDADQPKVQQVIDNLTGLKVTETVVTKPDDEITKSYNLDAGHALHVVATKNGQPVLDVLFGKSSGRGEMARIGSGPIFALSGYSSYLYGVGDADRFRSKGPEADALAAQAAARAAAASAAQLKASAKIERTDEDDKCVSDGKPPRGLSITGGTYDHNYEVATSMGCVRSHVYYPQQGHTVIDNYYCCP
jgi:hypothetical protein